MSPVPFSDFFRSHHMLIEKPIFEGAGKSAGIVTRQLGGREALAALMEGVDTCVDAVAQLGRHGIAKVRFLF